MLTYKQIISAILYLVVMVGFVQGFTNEEMDMFKLQKYLTDKYGPDMDLYQFLKLPDGSRSSTKQVTKHLRKLARKFHPDKNPKYRKLYQRLNMATQIITNHSLRKSYDYYLEHGFPDYDYQKGGFYFNRLKPHTWILLAFVVTVTSVIQYALLKIQYKSKVKRINTFISQCKQQDDTHGLGTKNLIFKQSEDDNGKELVIKFGDVFLKEDDGVESLISADTIEVPSAFDCYIFTIPRYIYRKLFPFKENKIRTTTTQAMDENEAITTTKERTGPQRLGNKSTMKLPNGKVIHSRKKD